MDIIDHTTTQSNTALPEDERPKEIDDASQKAASSTQLQTQKRANEATTLSFASTASDGQIDPRSSLIEKAAVAATYVKHGDVFTAEQESVANGSDTQSDLKPATSISKWSTSTRSEVSPPGGSRIMRRVSGTIKRVRTPMGLHQEAQNESPKVQSPRTLRPRKASLNATRDRSRSPFPLHGGSPRSKRQSDDQTLVKDSSMNRISELNGSAMKIGEKSTSVDPVPAKVSNPTKRGRLAKESSAPQTGLPPREHSRSRMVLNKINHLFSGKRSKKAVASPAPPIPPLLKRKPSRDTLREKSLPPKSSTHNLNPSTPLSTTSTPRPARPSQGNNTTSPSPFTPRRIPPIKPNATTTPPRPSPYTSGPSSLTQPLNALRTPAPDRHRALTARLVQIARNEPSPSRRERLFHFAAILTDAVIQAREAEISAETAAAAARSAAISHQMTVTAVEMIGRLVGSLGGASPSSSAGGGGGGHTSEGGGRGRR
jgi:hypothetical protein